MNSSTLDASLPIPHPSVIFRALPDGAVLFHSEEEVYFGLNPVGARIWELLPPTCQTLSSLSDQLANQYPDADRHELRTDVIELLDQLRTERLVVPSPRDVPAEAPGAPLAPG